MNGNAKILKYDEDNGKDKDGRLTISIVELPNEEIDKFLNWLGNEFINKGELYAVDVVNPKGVYRVYKDKTKKNDWV